MALLKAFLPWDQVSAHALRKDRILAILRAGALVGLLFAALVCGLWVGMNWSAFLCAPIEESWIHHIEPGHTQGAGAPGRNTSGVSSAYGTTETKIAWKANKTPWRRV
jgi:hypothetical protein